MTNINCVSHCIHQVNGKCNLEQIMTNTLSNREHCVYFEKKEPQRKNPSDIS